MDTPGNTPTSSRAIPVCKPTVSKTVNPHEVSGRSRTLRKYDLDKRYAERTTSTGNANSSADCEEDLGVGRNFVFYNRHYKTHARSHPNLNQLSFSSVPVSLNDSNSSQTRRSSMKSESSYDDRNSANIVNDWGKSMKKGSQNFASGSHSSKFSFHEKSAVGPPCSSVTSCGKIAAAGRPSSRKEKPRSSDDLYKRKPRHLSESSLGTEDPKLSVSLTHNKIKQVLSTTATPSAVQSPDTRKWHRRDKAVRGRERPERTKAYRQTSENDEKENCDLRQTERGERKSKRKKELQAEEALFKTAPKQIPVTVFVKLDNVAVDRFDAESFLHTRMNCVTKVKLRVVKQEQYNGNTILSIELQSKSIANKALSFLKLSNHSFKTQIFCTTVKTEVLGKDCLLHDESEFDRQVALIEKKATRTIENHEEKIRLNKQQIQMLLTNKFVSVEEFEKKQIEKETLQDKQEELENQIYQFKSYCKCLTSALKELWEGGKFDKTIGNLRLDFGIECNRLESALPMYSRRNEIISIIKDSQVSVILGETGSGKSTQITQYLHQAGFSKHGMIVCTQPRKVAAVSLATHVASELVTNVGNIVGYKIGMKCKSGGATKVMYMTDHCLLNECLKDPTLSAYSCIIVDEAHERSIYTDLLLGMLKRCIKTRSELKVIITSATIDPDIFVHFFGGCPVLKVSGRMFPVDVVYQEADDEVISFDNYLHHAVTKAVHIHKTESPGDILCFVTSPIETEKCCEDMKTRLAGRTDFVCQVLHGQVQPEEQQKVFKPPAVGVRKIVFATNSAETSITIPGIKYVIDTGLVKEKRYDPRRNISSLSVVFISKSSSDQRKGRAGRTGPGKCFRLYSEEMYKAMDTVAKPEILKIHLGQAVLKLAEMGINPVDYEFVQSPGPAAIAAAMESLEELGAVQNGVITDAGRELVKLPVEPRLGLIIQIGRERDLLFDSVVLAAVCSIGSSIFYRGGTPEGKKKLDQLKVQFCHPGGDSLTLLSVYRTWNEQPEKQKNKWCFDNGINAKSIKIVRETVNEIITALQKDMRTKIKHEFREPEKANHELQKILFEVFASNLCHFLGIRRAGYFAGKLAQQVHVHPSSALNPLNLNPEWITFEQSLKTTKDFITGCVPAEDAWVAECITSGRLKLNLEEMKKKSLMTVHTESVGSFIFWKLVGPYYTKLRELEEIAAELAKPDMAFVEASKETGELTIYSSDQSNTKLKNLFTDRIDPFKEELKMEEIETPLIPEKMCSVRVIIGKGGIPSDILMADEYRTVFIEKADEETSEDTVRDKFSQFGGIKQQRQFRNQSKRWGCLTFQTAAAARQAVEMTKFDDTEVAAPERKGGGYRHSEFKVKISWCRRESRGFGFADVVAEELPQLLARRYLWIRGRMIDIKLDRKTNKSIYLNKLDLDTNEDDIKIAIMEALQRTNDRPDTVITKVNVVREKVQTTEEQLDAHKRSIMRDIKRHTDKFHLNMMTPNPHNVKFLGFATFQRAEEGILTCRELSKRIYVNGRVVTLEPDVKSSLFVSQEIYVAVKDELEQYIELFPTMGYAEVAISTRSVKGGTLVNLQASDSLELAKVRGQLQEIIQGDILSCGASPDLKHLFSRNGREFLRETDKKHGAYIQVDYRTLSLSIHGREKVKTQTKIAINEYLTHLANSEFREVDLRSKDKPNGVMKCLMKKYGLELEKLQEETGLRSLVLNFKQQRVKMCGSAEQLDSAATKIEEECLTLMKGQTSLRVEGEEGLECGICFCPIDAKDLYRLQTCGHAFCMDCIQRQVDCAVKGKDMPISCSQEGCNEMFAWKDFSNLSRQGAFTVATLARSSVSAFVTKNRNKFRYCLTPNCDMVYKNTEDGAVFHCSECDVRICTSCHTQSHDGLTCAMYKSAKKDEGSLEQYLAAHAMKTKKCPQCSTPIEKIEGCNKMHCTACQCIFCWLCTLSFRSDDDCYSHLTKKHGGIFHY